MKRSPKAIANWFMAWRHSRTLRPLSTMMSIAGVFSGLWGLLFMPLLGAAIGQYLYDRDLIRARNVGIATWLGMVIGMLIKIALTFLMIGIFVFALVTP